MTQFINIKAKLERNPNAKRIRPRVGWLPIGRTRAQWHDAEDRVMKVGFDPLAAST